MAKLVSANLTGDKLCILTYTTEDGKMLSFSFEEVVFGAKIISHSYTDKAVVIFDKPITKIGYSYPWLDIDQEVGAFEGCISLTSVTIPDSVTAIRVRAFALCYSLTSITIPDSVTSIGKSAFYGCSSLTSLTIPDSVTAIGKSAFFDCSSLKEFKGKFASPDGRCLIVDGVLNSFAPAGLTEYTIPDSVTAIGARAFDGCKSLTSITIPDSVTSIGYATFRGCSSLASGTIGNSVTEIGMCAFDGCKSLTSITIPDSVTLIRERAFDKCSSLKEFKGKFASPDGRCLIIDGVLNSFAPAGLTEYTIPDSVTAIGARAFAGCSSLTSVTIPDSITSIGEGAFDECSSLTSITIGNSVTEIGMRAFYGCKSLTSVTIPDSVTLIRERAFDGCDRLKTIICKAENPPKIKEPFWGETLPKFDTLIVPEGCEEAYLNSDWSHFFEEEN